MSLPPFALAAALAFWGWRSGHYVPAALLGLLIEGPRFVGLRFELRHADYARIADACTLLFIGMLAWLFIGTEPPRTARAVLTSMLWLPALLSPLMIAQRLSAPARVPLSALFRYLRKMRARDPDYRETEVDLAPLYFAVCIVAAGIPNQRDDWFYPVLALLAAWPLLVARPAHARLAASLAAFAAAAILGYGAHAGLGGAQAALEEWVSERYLRGMAGDAYRATTDLGAVGRLKMIDSIVLRVYPQAGRDTPRLLHRASFTTLEGTTWVARQAPMAAVLPQADGTSWHLSKGSASVQARMFIRLEGGKAMLALPGGTVRVTDMAAASVKRNALGAMLADFGGDWAPYTAETSDATDDYAEPRSDDLQLPRRERDAIEALALDLGLKALAPADAVKRVREHLGAFRYSTYRDEAVKGTPIADFLFRSKRGHCEYFAAATTLLLRAGGIPARYATGFAVYEFSPLEKAYVVRARHAHAWSRAFVDGRWIEVDTTPPSWIGEEERLAPAWQRLADLWRWAEFRWGQRGAIELGAAWGAALALVLAFLAWRFLRGKRAAARAEPPKVHRVVAGTDSEFYAIESRLAATAGSRAPHETLGAWLARVAPGEPNLHHALLLHYRYRFDPQGLDVAERRALSEQCRALHARLESPHG
jgi:protein-glutamine gamma-glutamyltransferase